MRNQQQPESRELFQEMRSNVNMLVGICQIVGKPCEVYLTPTRGRSLRRTPDGAGLAVHARIPRPVLPAGIACPDACFLGPDDVLAARAPVQRLAAEAARLQSSLSLYRRILDSVGIGNQRKV